MAGTRAQSTGRGLLQDLGALLSHDQVAPPSAHYLADAAQWRGLRGRADVVAFPESTEEVARLLAWCSRHDLAVTPRGGGTGLAGGAVPTDGGVVLALERMSAVRQFDPHLWRINVEAGLRTAELHRLAATNGLLFAPDPGAGEQSQLGGNIATNAGGPHAYKYGTMRSWVSGLEAVLPGGEAIKLGGWARKDVAGYDLLGLLVGSEGTLAVITAAWLKLLPAPEVVLPLVAIYPDVRSGCAAIERVIGEGLQAAALEYLDAGALAAGAHGYPGELPPGGGFMVIAEADGSRAEAQRLREELRAALGDGARQLDTPETRKEIEALWRWRGGVSGPIAAARGGKISEDIVVPVDRLGEAIEESRAIGARHELSAVGWGHAGDGNLHSSFLIDPGDAAELERGLAAAEDLFALAVSYGGAVSGEHGVGWVKRGQLARQWTPAALELHDAVKHAFDPKNLLNPGKKPGVHTVP